MADGRTVIDSLDFARTGAVLKGRVPVAALDRLADVLVDRTGALDYELRGELDDEEKPCIDLRVRGELQLSCQRCLSSLSYRIDIDRRLMLVAPGQAWPDEDLADDRMDAIEASHDLAVLPLIEDEVLLVLPIVPRHEVCQSPVATEIEHRPSPFAMLAKLKDH